MGELIKYLVLLSQAAASCFDGNNGGCSHYCVAGTCSCPSCWTLGADGKTCAIESGRASVTCSATGAKVVVDKCVFQNFEQDDIHLKESTCAAVEQDEDNWVLTTGFSECGSEIAYADDKLTFANALMVGHGHVGGMRRSRKYEMSFVCNYNSKATVSKSFKTNDAAIDASFDINDINQVSISFGFAFDFFESNDFTNKVNLTAGAVQPGSSIFAGIESTSVLPENWEFSVAKCTVSDPAIGQSFDILDSCPVEGTNFLFKNGQSDENSVNFSFMSFVFAASASDAVLDISCDAHVCPKNLAACLLSCPSATTTTTAQTTTSEETATTEKQTTISTTSTTTTTTTTSTTTTTTTSTTTSTTTITTTTTSTSTTTSTTSCPNSLKYTFEECSTIVDCNPIAPQKDNLLVNNTAALHFSMSIDVFCDNILPMGDFKNIIHVTKGDRIGSIGSRVFGIWRQHNNPDLVIQINHPTNIADKYKAITTPCNQGEWNTYSLEIQPKADDVAQVVYTVKQDGNELMSGSYAVSGAYSSGPLYFYAGSPWKDEGSSYLIKNFFYCIGSTTTTTTTTTTVKTTTTTTTSTITTTTSTTTTTAIAPSDVNIMVLAPDLTNSYIIAGDGLTISSPVISAPSVNYARNSRYAVVKGVLYIFGGNGEGQKIAKLDGCNLVDTGLKTIKNYGQISSAIDIDDGERALICFASDAHESCEIFNTTDVSFTAWSKFKHRNAAIGYYMGKPTTVGDYQGYPYNKITETYSNTGWTRLQDHPAEIHNHDLVGLDNGSMLMMGGWSRHSGVDWREHYGIWRLKNNNWKKIGTLIKLCQRCSVIKSGNYIMAFNGHFNENGQYPIQRIEVKVDEIVSRELIGNHGFFAHKPVLFEVEANHCTPNTTTTTTAQPTYTCVDFFQPSNDEVNWSTAKQRCEDLGASLSYFENSEEYTKFQTLIDLNQRTWLGIERDSSSSTGWITVTGAQNTFFKWNTGEPNNGYGGTENCVEIYPPYPTSTPWNDAICDQLKKFSCRRETISDSPC